jgi:hypothetical protein
MPLQYRVPGLVPGGKVTMRGIHYSSLSSGEVKNEWIYTSVTPIRIHGVDKNKRVGKGKAIPLQTCTCPEGSRRFRLPDFKTNDT